MILFCLGCLTQQCLQYESCYQVSHLSSMSCQTLVRFFTWMRYKLITVMSILLPLPLLNAKRWENVLKASNEIFSSLSPKTDVPLNVNWYFLCCCSSCCYFFISVAKKITKRENWKFWVKRKIHPFNLMNILPYFSFLDMYIRRYRKASEIFQRESN